MESRNPPPQKPKPLIGKDGQPVINQYGHVVSAQLTDEDKAAIDKLVRQGYSKKAICKELAVSERRLLTYLKEPKVAQAIALTYLVEEQANTSKTILELITAQTEIIAKMERRLSDLQTEVQLVKKAAARITIGREKAERTARSQRQELTRLRKLIWKRTGKKL